MYALCPIRRPARRFGLLGLVLGGLLLTAGCALPLPAEQQEPDPDQALEAQVKIALIDALDVAAAALRAEADAGVVTLTGFVETEAERTRAVTVTRAVPEVTQVVDEIQIK